MTNRFCTNCGSSIGDGMRFCIECGTPADAAPPETPPFPDETIYMDSPQLAEKPPVTAEIPVQQTGDTGQPAYAAQQTAAGQPVPMQPGPGYQGAPYGATPQPAYIPPAAIQGADAKPASDSPYAPISVKGWIGIMLLMLLVPLNIIFLIVWACGGCKKITKKNFARATLIFMVISLILGAILSFAAKKFIDGLIADYGFSQDYDFSQNYDLSGGGKSSSDFLGGLLSSDDDSADSLVTDDEMALLKAVMEGDRQALIDLGYSEEEIDQVLAVLGGDLSGLIGQ